VAITSAGVTYSILSREICYNAVLAQYNHFLQCIIFNDFGHAALKHPFQTHISIAETCI